MKNRLESVKPELAALHEIVWPATAVLLAALLSLAGLGSLGAASPAQAEVLNRIVLRVNDRIATLQDYEVRRSQLVGELLQQGLSRDEQMQQMEQLGERVFSDLYEELMLLSRADQLDIRITDRQLDTVIDQMREQMGIPDRQAFRTAVEQSGLGFEEFKQQWRSQLRMREVITREVEMPIQEELKEEDLRRFYRNNPEQFRTPEKHKLREVVVLDDSELSEAERDRLARAIAEELRAGRTLDEVVPSHAEAGVTSDIIDLGWVQQSELSPELRGVVEAAAPGTVTDPVPARGGLHVCVVEDFEESTLQSFDQVADEIRRIERRRLRDERVPAYMEELEQLSYIRIDPPPGAQKFRQYRGSMTEELPELPEETETPASTGDGELSAKAEAAIRDTDEAFKEVTVEVPVGPAPEDEAAAEAGEGDEGSGGDEADEGDEAPPEEAPPGS